MLTAVDHIVLQAASLAEAVAAYERLGFRVSYGQPEGTDPDRAYVVFDDLYLELRAADGPAGAEGLTEVVLRSDDIDSDAGRVRAAGIRVSDIVQDPIDGEGGSLSRRSAVVDLFTPMRFVEHDHDAETRLTFMGGRGAHPNTATALERTYVAVESIERDLPTFERVFGTPAPEPEMGTVIMSLMSVFYFGTIGIAIAEPRGEGPTADALEAGGPGLFQILFRAEHIDEAARIITANGAPAPRRGTRLSGESALLILPEDAGNAYVALAGPA